jgi:hypothetical protein
MQRAEKTLKPLADTPQRQATEPSARVAGIHNSQRMVAQRQQLREAFGAAAQLRGSEEMGPQQVVSRRVDPDFATYRGAAVAAVTKPEMQAFYDRFVANEVARLSAMLSTTTSRRPCARPT